MRRALHTLATVAVVLVTGLGTPAPFAVCRGPDGHRAIELINAACCHPSRPGDAGPQLASCAAGGCEDILLSADPALQRGDRFAAQAALTAAVASSVPSLLQAYRAAAVVACAPMLSPPPPRERHTTVIVC